MRVVTTAATPGPEQLERYQWMLGSGDWSEWDEASDIWPTRGPQAERWLTSMLCYGPGQLHGQPYRLRDDQRSWLAEWFSIHPRTGLWRYDTAVRMEARGGAKTELVAGLGALELAGPSSLRSDFSDSPDVVVMAASFEQADILFSTAKEMMRAGPLADHFEFFDTEILPLAAQGRMARVAAVAPTQEGLRASLACVDEGHSILGNRERAFTVVTASLRKRKPRGRAVVISTAGAGRGQIPAAPTDPLMWRLYAQGLEKIADPSKHRRLFFWSAEADPKLNPEVREERAAMVEQSSGAADVIWSVEDRVEAWDDPGMQHHEWVRYYGNQWVRVASDSWLSDHPGAWDHCEDSGLVAPPDGADVWLGVDASWKGDASALGLVWPRPDGRVGWWADIWVDLHGTGVPFDEIEARIAELHDRLRVRALVFDPRFMAQLAQRCERVLGIDEVIEVPQSLQRRAKIDEHARMGIISGVVVHDGNPLLAEHVANAAWKESDSGRVLSKRRSGGHIDALIACAMAHWEATAPAEETSSPAPFVFFGSN